MDANRWINTAVDTKHTNEKLRVAYSNVGTDGLRLHIDNNTPALPKELVPFDYSYIVNPVFEYNNHLEVDQTVFLSMAKAALALKKGLIKIIFSNATRSLTIEANTDDSITMELKYTVNQALCNCQDFTVGINSKFLVDAIAGLDCENNVILSMDGKIPDKKPLYFHCGNRQAIVMPMYLG